MIDPTIAVLAASNIAPLLNPHESESVGVLKKRKANLEQQLKIFRFTWWGFLLSSIVGSSLVFIFNFGTEKTNSELIRHTLSGGLLGLFIYFYIIGATQYNYSTKLRRIEIDLAKAGADELQETIEENFFTKLVQINFKYLDQYYLQTQEQADKSFNLSRLAGISGLSIVIIGIIMMYYGKTQPAYVTTAAGIVSEFIAAVFFFLYNRTILKMSQYHQKLVMTQNISLALKITEDMTGESKIKAQEILIDRLTHEVNKYLSL